MADKKPGGSSFVLLLSFLVVAFVLFDPTLRDFLARGVGFVFDPLFGFGGRYPLWTVALAGIVMILASTVIRHFLVDWVKMARVQEVMRHFQKEFREAQKSNNTYRMKRLTEAQPEIMKLQADMSGEQMKPMAFTMIVVVPIFLWLSGAMAVPVHYALTHEGAGDVVALGYGDDLWSATVVATGDDGELDLTRTSHVHAFSVDGAATGTVRMDGETGGTSFAVDGAAALPPGRAVNLSTGSHVVKTADNLDIWNPEEPAKLNKALLVLLAADGSVDRVIVVGPTPVTVAVDAPTEARILVPAAPNAAPRGNPVQVWIGDERHDFFAADVWFLPTADGQVTITPKTIRVPWNTDWDLNENWKFLPRWIILYTLISIPLGTVTQKVLKKWEFQRIDLDADGRPAGKSL
ncbi:MAG TPA: EMC3/TMCO1 family protein [Candidatus Thermoplasmatota archaeon]|nr:EMC3/TMCO1 family protein [Candidatus Thermoplasmatota archaeon]